MAGKNWIAGAIKKPGALHRQLGVPAGKKIPKAAVAQAAKAGGTLGRRARLAQTLGKMNHAIGFVLLLATTALADVDLPRLPSGAIPIVRNATGASTLYTGTLGRLLHVTGAWLQVGQVTGNANNCEGAINSVFIRDDDGATNRRFLDIITPAAATGLVGASTANEVTTGDVPILAHCSTTTALRCSKNADCPSAQTCTVPTVTLTLTGTGCTVIAGGIIGWEEATTK